MEKKDWGTVSIISGLISVAIALIAITSVFFNVKQNALDKIIKAIEKSTDKIVDEIKDGDKTVENIIHTIDRNTELISNETREVKQLIINGLYKTSQQIQYLQSRTTPPPSPTPQIKTPDYLGLYEASNIVKAPTPLPLFNVYITKPKDKDKVSWREKVEGSSSATEDSGFSAYVLIWPIEVDGPWWVQFTTTYSDGFWQSYAYFGRDPSLYPEDIGTNYKVVMIITKHELRGGQTFTELPEYVGKSNEIIVTRK
ncbi:hypothetical protein LCGC14_2110580 [marine sediment metagenome]|uniref:Uncharacterized protein n=1 Tax=marine sediment metagenome TaxID=412755 RepID=A0A0F9E7B2_9ZZZZ